MVFPSVSDGSSPWYSRHPGGMAPQRQGNAATLVPMETELGQEEQKALQGHQSKGECNGDSQSLGTFPRFSQKHRPSISPMCPRPLGRGRSRSGGTGRRHGPTAKVPHGVPLLPWLGHWSGASQDAPQEECPTCAWHLL